MKQLKEPKATEKAAKNAVKAASAENLAVESAESAGELTLVLSLHERKRDEKKERDIDIYILHRIYYTFGTLKLHSVIRVYALNPSVHYV